MAFIDFRPDAWTTAPESCPTAVPALFTPLERTVLALSRREAASSLRPAGRFRRALARFFAVRRANPLADPRLEALRRFAVAARLGTGGSFDRELAAFLDHGFSASQAAAVRLAVAA